MRRRTIFISMLLVAAACGGDEDRLVPKSDPQFGQLEAPEADGECEAMADCEQSCVHSCVAISAAPMTCPAEPTDPPERIAGASCDCEETRCQWN